MLVKPAKKPQHHKKADLASVVEDIPAYLEWHISDVNARRPSSRECSNIGCLRKLGMWCIYNGSN